MWTLPTSVAPPLSVSSSISVGTHWVGLAGSITMLQTNSVGAAISTDTATSALSSVK